MICGTRIAKRGDEVRVWHGICIAFSLPVENFRCASYNPDAVRVYGNRTWGAGG
jgi:hypothetical protein